MKEKICENCNLVLPVCEFWTVPQRADGYDRNCKTCRKELTKKRNKETGRLDLSNLRFNQLRTSDHYHSYKLLERLGYDLESDKSIHEQFCDRHGLQVKKRDKPHTMYKSWSQVKKNPQ